MAKYRRKDPLGWGIILIVIGLIFLLQNFDYEIWGTLARLWPVVLIVWGAWKLYFGFKERSQESAPTEDEP